MHLKRFQLQGTVWLLYPTMELTTVRYENRMRLRELWRLQVQPSLEVRLRGLSLKGILIFKHETAKQQLSDFSSSKPKRCFFQPEK